MKNELLEKIEKGIIISIILSIIVYAVFFFFTDWASIISSVEKIGLALIIILLILSLLNYAMRFLRWEVLIRNAKIKIKLKDSLKSFLAGLCLTITPGKAGELFKASFVKKYSNTSRLKVLPIVILERIFDLTGFASILLISLLFVSFENYASAAMQASIIIFAALIFSFLFIKTRICREIIKKVINKFSFLKKKEEIILEVLDDYSAISFTKIMALIVLSFLGWFFEVIELYLLFNVFNINADIFMAGFVFGFSSLIGLISFTPGGIIGFEASSGLLLSNLLGLTVSTAAVITLIIRLTTLWFAVLI